MGYSHVPTWWKQPHMRSFCDLYFAKLAKPVFFVGSGLSLNAGLPNWATLLTQLAKLIGDDLHDPALAERVESHLVRKKKEYHAAGALLKLEAGKSESKDLWRKSLAACLNPPSVLNSPSLVHNALAKLRCEGIVTTNYDVLIERAFDGLKSQEKLRIFTPWRDLEQLEHSPEKFLFKIHGDIADEKNSIVLAQEDYEELYQADDPLRFQRALGSIVRHASVILFMGYSHDDDFVSKIFDSSFYLAFRDKIFTLVPRIGDPESFAEQARRYRENLQVRCITYSPDDQHRELLTFLEYLSLRDQRDEEYARAERVRRPTVVMLYCGGTIGSASKEGELRDGKPLDVERKTSRYDTDLVGFSERLLRWYRQAYTAGDSIELDLTWEILPKEQQLLSENATPQTWNSVLEELKEVIYKYFHAPSSWPEAEYGGTELWELFKREHTQFAAVHPEQELTDLKFLSEFRNRYVLGIVLLFGTDTLAQLAPALSLSLQHLPCPVVITGANQPPQDRDEIPRGQFNLTSDAWRNLMTSIYFLQSFGHRLTEMFVCFGDTVHHGVNLRKRALEIIPLDRLGRSKKHDEPFTFRNLTGSGQYMFKLVEGVFCNNYYPSSHFSYSTLADPQSQDFRTLRHIRWEALRREPSNRVRSDSFSSSVWYIEVSPCFPDLNYSAILKDPSVRSRVRAVLVEGYASGTYPSTEQSPFSELLYALYEAEIPIVLVSRYGIMPSQQEYQTLKIRGVEVPVLRLYDVIAETALPLLSLVIDGLFSGRAQEEVGESTVDNVRVGRLNSRIEAIRRGIDNLIKDRPNIISEEFKDITDRERRLWRLFMEGEKSSTRVAQDNPLNYITSLALLEEGKNVHGSVFMSQQEFGSLINEIVKPFAKVGAGPDGLAILANMGFKQGLSLAEDFSRRTRVPKFAAAGFNPFFERSQVDQDELLATANLMIAGIAKWMKNVGVADLEADTISISIRDPLFGGEVEDVTRPAPRSFSFSVRIARRVKGTRGGERFAAISYSSHESKLFSDLLHGRGEDSICEAYYTEIVARTWEHLTQTIDWFVLGLFKAVGYTVARMLRFDRLAVRSLETNDNGYKRVLRQAVKADVGVGDENYFGITYSYFEALGRLD